MFLFRLLRDREGAEWWWYPLSVLFDVLLLLCPCVAVCSLVSCSQ